MTGENNPIRHLDGDECIDLLHGHLGPEDEARIVDHAATCPSCEEVFRDAVRAFESARATPGLVRDEEGRLVRELPARTAVRSDAPAARPTAPPRRSWAFRWRAAWAGIGLVGAVAAVLLLFLRSDEPRPADTASYWIPADREVVRLRAGIRLDEGIEAGLRAYRERDTTTAIARLQDARTDGAYDVLRRIYLGSALLNDGRADEAAAALGDLSMFTIPEPWRSDARWILALALLESGREDQARTPLEALASGDGPLAERARTRLKEIGP